MEITDKENDSPDPNGIGEPLALYLFCVLRLYK